MRTKTAIANAGSAVALAKILNITPGAISQWGEDMPEGRVWQLRVLRPEWFVETVPVDAVAQQDQGG